MEIALLVAGLIVFAWLLIIVSRQDIRQQLPWFAFYVTWEFFAQLTQLGLWLVRRQWYYGAFWWMEAVEIGLTVAAVRESFLRIFQGFTRKPGFRWSVWSVIIAVVAYSAWKAVYAPPLQSSRLDSFVFGTEFLFRWGFLGITALTVVLSFLMREGITREDAVVTGFGAAAGAFLLYLGSFSLFGTKYIFLTKYIPSVGYFVAGFWWIYVFSRPVRQFGFEELGMGPEEIRKVLRRYRDSGERL
ncbi:MAG TPA: hypothetical protein VKY85_01880 [Candidatus Angelobacter sp.]|nr:hypothetical protein [Candidatus Angelobacter sp.]